MPSLLLIVLLLQIAIHLVNTLGSAAINEIAWQIYTRLPTPHAALIHRVTAQRRDLVRVKTELRGISAQDEFSRWAKLRRVVDKLEAEYNDNATKLQTHRTRFDTTVSSARWVLTNGLRLFLIFWYARTPMFFLPRGLVPGVIEWLLAFPRAPRGSVSIQVWSMACASVVGLVSEVVVAVWVLATGRAGVREGVKVEEKKEL